MEILLASTSIYRKRLLERLGLPFQTVKPGINEDDFKNKSLPAEELAKTLAYEKAFSVQKQNAIIIGSDQLVSFKNEILGKSGNAAENLNQLKKLSGGKHKLITAVCVLLNEKKIEWTETALIEFRNLTLREMESAIAADQSWDCAGGYKLESRGISLVKSIECADWSAIEGLPIIRLNQVLLDLLN